MLRRYGPAGACIHVVQVIGSNFFRWQYQRRFAAKQAAFDRKWGVQTAVRIRPEDLDVVGPNRAAAVPYQPIGEEPFRVMMGALTNLIGSRFPLYTFVDMGCGMGKALLLAAEHPFRQIVGVEFARHLATICEQNVYQVRDPAHRLCQSIKVVVTDATQFSFPDGPLIVFLYNPFGPQVLIPMLNNLRTAAATKPNETFVVYLNARHSQLLEEVGFRPVWVDHEDRIFKFDRSID